MNNKKKDAYQYCKSRSCPNCQSTHINKNGHKRGKQNYICKNCGRQFIEDYKPHKGYSETVKSECM